MNTKPPAHSSSSVWLRPPRWETSTASGNIRQALRGPPYGRRYGQPTLVHFWQPVVSKYSPLLTVTRPWPWRLALAMIASNSPEAFLVRAQ